MITLITILILIAALGSFANAAINNRRQIAFNAIDNLYDKIELYIIQNDIILNSKMATLLRGMKIFKTNHEFADIHVLLVTRRRISIKDFEKNKKEYNELISTLPEGLLALKKSFDSQIKKATFLSIFRFEFLIFFMYLLGKSMIKSAFERSGAKLSLFFQMLSDLFKYENLVVSKYSQSSYRLA